MSRYILPTLLAAIAFGAVACPTPAFAQRAAAAADARVDAARSQLRAVVRAKRAEFEARPEVLEAKQAAEAARAEYDPHRERVVGELMAEGGRYAELANEAAALQKELDDSAGRQTDEAVGDVVGEADPNARAATTRPVAGDSEAEPTTRPTIQTEPPPLQSDGLPHGRDSNPDADLDDLLTDESFAEATPGRAKASAKVLELNTLITQMEENAIAADAEAAAAKAQWEAASTKYAAMKQTLRGEILNDPEYKQAQNELEQAVAALREAADRSRNRRYNR